MRSISSYVPARRARRLLARRTRRRPVFIAAGVGAALITMVGFAGAAPVSQAEASGISSFALASYTTSVQPTVSVAKTTTTAAEIEAENALDAADDVVAAAQTVTGDITASGLDVGVAQTTVDVTELQESADRLELAIESLPAVLLPSVVDDVREDVTAVGAEVAGLRGRLDAAVAVKAQKDAEEKARLEAEAAAAAAAAAEAEAAASASSSSSSSSGSRPTAAVPGGYGAGDNSPAGAQAYAYSRLGAFGWGDDQFGCLVALWNRESGWNYLAHNSSSGAHGIPQALPGSKMASAGADWETNAATQVEWGFGYIAGRYSSPCGAWDHSESVGWY